MAKSKSPTKKTRVESYEHSERTPMRPEVGTQALFKKRKQPQTYEYDSSLSPALEWDGQNSAREQGEAFLGEIRSHIEQLRAGLLKGNALPADLSPEQQLSELQTAHQEAIEKLTQLEYAADKLKALSHPFLNWTGKAERLSFDVPTLPLFIHERLSTQAIIQTLQGHKRDKQQALFDLFGDPQRSIADQVLRAYEFEDQWTNRMILGDSLVVMNSLLHYESLGGKVQMIYLDPPYGVKFGSNFQPFVRKRDVRHNDDDDMTREPEMVQAYRDTWELGLHSYLTYLRDRLLLARDLLTPSGSIFVQISDENLHHVREVMDEVFGAENFVSQIAFQKTPYATSQYLAPVYDVILFYAKNRENLKYHELFVDKSEGANLDAYRYIESPDGQQFRTLTTEELMDPSKIPANWKRFQSVSLISSGASSSSQGFEFNDKTYFPPVGSHWKTTVDGLLRTAQANRIFSTENSVRFKSYLTDLPISILHNIWTDTLTGSFTEAKLYVVQTPPKVIQRCLLMTTDPGDLVLDPTCGSGTTAYVAEQWGRRWITIDTSRVPLALARQRLLTATFPYYELKDEPQGPASGFVYKRKQNKKGEEIGGIVPHITLKSIANNEPPAEEVLVDRPEVKSGITRVTGPFTFEATIPTAADLELQPDAAPTAEETSEAADGFTERMIEVLRKSPVLHLDGNRTVSFKNLRVPTKTLSLSAEALVEMNGAGPQPVAIVFGPENGAVSEGLVFEAAREALAKSYQHLYVIGFAIQPNARQLVDNCNNVIGVSATYVQATLDLMMGDLLKNMRSSQIFSVCGLPEIRIIAPPSAGKRGAGKSKQSEADANGSYQVELLGLDVFDPTTMDVEHRKGNDVPAWFLDTDYNGLCFHVGQAFFPRTSAWDNLKKALKGTYEEDVWHHLAGTLSAPFAPGEHQRIAVKVIDDRGNELLVVKDLKEGQR